MDNTYTNFGTIIEKIKFGSEDLYQIFLIYLNKKYYLCYNIDNDIKGYNESIIISSNVLSKEIGL